MVDLIGTLQQGANTIGSGLSSAPGYLSTIAQQAFRPPPLPQSTPNIPPPPSFNPPALPQSPQQQMRRKIDEPSPPFNSFVSTPSTNINIPNTQGFNRPIPSPSITRLDMPEPAKNQPSFQPTPSIPVINKPEMSVTSTLTKPSSISLDFKTQKPSTDTPLNRIETPPFTTVPMGSVQMGSGVQTKSDAAKIFENANQFVKDKTQVEKIIPTWEDTFGGIADVATGKYPNTSGKQSDLTYTEQLKVWTAGDKGYTKFVAPTTQRESDNFDPKLGVDKYRYETYKAPEGFLRDVAVPFTKKLWDLPRDEPVTAAVYYATPLLNAGIPMAAGKVLQAPAAAPLLNVLTKPGVGQAIDVGSKALLGTTVAQQGAYVAGYDPFNSAPLSQKPKDVAERSVSAMVNIVPMFAFTKGIQKIPGEANLIDDQIRRTSIREFVNPEKIPLSPKTFTHQEMIDKINAPISANRITMSPNEPAIISEGSKIARQAQEHAATIASGKVIGRFKGDENSVFTFPLTNAAIVEKAVNPSVGEIASIHSHPSQIIKGETIIMPHASSPDIKGGMRDAAFVPGYTKHYVASEKGITGFEVMKPSHEQFATDVSDFYEQMSKNKQVKLVNAPDWAIRAEESGKLDLTDLGSIISARDAAIEQSLTAPTTKDYKKSIALRNELDVILASAIKREANLRPVAMEAAYQKYGAIKPLRDLPIDVPFYMRKPKKSKPKIKTNKKPIKRGSLYEKKSKERIHEILANRKQVEQIEMPFKAQQITGSPQQKMSVWLKKYADEPNEHYIVSSQTGDFITNKEGLSRSVPDYVIQDALDDAEKITGKKYNESSWIHLHNHPTGLNIPSYEDNEAFITMNIKNQARKLGKNLAPDRYGIIDRRSARILKYPNPLKEQRPISEILTRERIGGNIVYKMFRDEYNPSDDRSAFNKYSKRRGIDNEIIDFDYNPLYKSRKKKSKKPKVNLGIKLPSIKLPTFKKIKSKKQ